MRFHRGLDLARCPIGAFDDDVGLGEPGRDVAAFAHRRLADQVAALLDGGRVRLQRRRLVVDDERQHLVFDLDRPDGVDGLERGFGGDRRDLLALVPAVVVEETAV